LQFPHLQHPLAISLPDQKFLLVQTLGVTAWRTANWPVGAVEKHEQLLAPLALGLAGLHQITLVASQAA
jgi:hypothetical protein